VKLFGFEVTFTRTKTALPPSTVYPADWRSGGLSNFFGVVKEAFAGAWQRNIEVDRSSVLTYGTVFACITLIASDISKLWLNLKRTDENGINVDAESASFSPVIRKPNRFSTRVKFFEYWIISKLSTGNTFVLKARDNRGVVTDLFVLDPTRVQPLIAPNGEVYYQLNTDYLAGLEDATVTVPASEIIHDIAVPLFHPLCGVSPLIACGLAAMQGLKIQNHSAKFFANNSKPGGVIIVPGNISEDQARALRENWAANYAGEDNIGKVVVLGDGMTYQPMTGVNATDAQLVDQLNWTAVNICGCFHVPGYMVGIGPPPPYTDIQSINLQYYTQALQNPIENLEILLLEGLELPRPYSVEFDLKALARMDRRTQIENATKAIAGSLSTINQERAEMDETPVKGGDAIWMQSQNWTLDQLLEREPPGTMPALPPAAPQPAHDEPPELDPEAIKQLEVREWDAFETKLMAEFIVQVSETDFCAAA
jgi:HK97 family phage portal protein